VSQPPVHYGRTAEAVPVIHSIPAAEDTLADLGDRLLVALRRPIVTAEGLVTAGGSVCERI